MDDYRNSPKIYRAGAAVVSTITSRKYSTRNVFSHLMRANAINSENLGVWQIQSPPHPINPLETKPYLPLVFFDIKTGDNYLYVDSWGDLQYSIVYIQEI